MVFHHSHLSAADTGANIAHAVVIADSLMLIIRISLSGLGGIPHNLVGSLLVRANQGTTTTGGDHLVTIKGEYTILAEGPQHLTIIARAKTLGSILDDGDIVLLPYLHDALDIVGHTVQCHWHDSLGVFTRLGLPVDNCLFK